MGAPVKSMVIAAAAAVSVPVAFVVGLAGPQAATDAANVAAFCRLALGAAPGPDTTVADLGGPDAATPAATLPDPWQLIGERAYQFVTTLNTIDNWRALPAADIAHWASDPPEGQLPAAARPLPGLPAELTVSTPAPDSQSAPHLSSYAVACAGLINRSAHTPPAPAIATATQTLVSPPAPDPTPVIGTTISALDLLRIADPAASEADPRLFYMNYPQAAGFSAGDVVLFDFTTAGPAHFGIATSTQQMVTTASAGTAVAQLWPIPANASTVRPAART